MPTEQRSSHSPIASTAQLAACQQDFADHLHNPGDTRAAAHFRGQREQTRNRLAIYRGSLAEHWRRTLAGAYPVLEMQVGEEFFAAMSRQYGHQHPSQSGDLNQFGGHLPEFVASFKPLADYPWLPDLARIEWALHQSHYAADGHPVTAEALAQLPPEKAASLPLSLSPSASLHRLDWQIAQLWQAHQQDPQPDWTENFQQPTAVLVYRPQWKPTVRALEPDEYRLLSRLSAGTTLEALLPTDASDSDTQTFFTHFARWLEDRLISTTAPLNP